MKRKSGYLTSRFERISYGMYFLGQDIIAMIVFMFIVVFLTDVGIPAVTVAVIVLAVRVWDAINETIFGGLIDRLKLKSGKFLPWLRFSLVLIPLATIFLFAIDPDLPLRVKVIWAVVGYILWDAAYTMCDVPINGLIATMTGNQTERNSIMPMARIFAMVGVLISVVLVPVARQIAGGWLPTVIILSAISMVAMTPACFAIKERAIPPRDDENKIGLRDMYRFVSGNKFLLIFFAAKFIYNSADIAGTLGMFMVRHTLGNEALQSVLGLIGIVPGLIVGAFIPFLSRKVDKFYLFFGAQAASMIMGVVIYFVGYESLFAFFALVFVRSIPMGMSGIMVFMFTPDCVEYGQFKTGINASGTGFAVQTFVAKLIAATSAAFGAAMLAAIGFIEMEGAVQVAGFGERLWMIYTLIPAAGLLLALPLLWKYKLRDADVQIMARANRNEITRKEALQMLNGRYGFSEDEF